MFNIKKRAKNGRYALQRLQNRPFLPYKMLIRLVKGIGHTPLLVLEEKGTPCIKNRLWFAYSS